MNRLVGDTLRMALGLVGAQLLMLAVLPLWSRLYPPEAFAAWAMFQAVLAVVSTLVLLRYDSMIVVVADEREAVGLVRLCLLLCALGGAALLLLLAVLPAALRESLGLTASPSQVMLLGILGGAATAALAALLAWANRQRAYARISLLRLSTVLVTALVGSVLGATGLVQGLLWAALAGVLVSLLLALGLQRLPAGGLAVLEVARRHPEAPRYLWPSGLLDTLTQQLPVLLTVAWFSSAQAGQFGLAWRVVAVPMLMLAAAAAPVVYERLARLQRDGAGAAAMRRLIGRCWAALALLGLAPVGVLLLAGGPVFGWAFGPGWVEAGGLAAAMAPMLLAMMVSGPTSGALIVLGLQRWSPVFGLAMLVYRPLTLWLGAQQGSLILGLLLWGLCELSAIGLYNRLIFKTLQKSP